MIANEDKRFMRQALNMATNALEKREVPIGCVIVWKRNVIASGCNDVNRTKNASRHAEMIAIEQVRSYCMKNYLSETEVLSQCTLYVTAEPCIMCAAALRLVNLTSIFFGCANQRFGGCGSLLDIHTKEINFQNTKLLSSGSKRVRMDKTGCDALYGTTLNCVGDILSEEAIKILKLFYAGENPNAPQQMAGRKESLPQHKEI